MEVFSCMSTEVSAVYCFYAVIRFNTPVGAYFWGSVSTY